MAYLKGEELEKYWKGRYDEEATGWDLGQVSPPIAAYVDQLVNKNLKILIPGAGNAHEAEYLHLQGFTQVVVLDIARQPLDHIAQRVPSFPKNCLIKGDFFEHEGQYDLILEQTFFCSFEPLPSIRKLYTSKMHSLLTDKGKLVGLWFQHHLNPEGNRPFGGSKEEYAAYFKPYFQTHTFSDCYNSINPRMGKELFGIFRKKNN